MKYALLSVLCLATVSFAQAAPPTVTIGYLPPGFSITKTVVDPASPMPPHNDGIPEDHTAARQVIFRVKGQLVRKDDFGMSNYVSVGDLQSADPKSYPSLTTAAKALKALLTKRPAPAAAAKSELPVYPPCDSSMEMVTHFTYVDAPWGSGYGAIVVFAQDTPRATNDDIAYYFQGLTKDGRHYITATFALSNPKLPATWEKADPKVTTAGDIKFLEKQPGESFAPPLDEIRKLLESVTITEK